MASPLPPELMEELVEEILLRFPPHEPALLVHAALVCKRWRRLVSAPGFRRRFRERHRTPPMLGFFHRCISEQGRNVGRFVHAAFRSPPRAESASWLALDARHGRVLLRRPGARFGTFAVLDLLTGKERRLPLLRRDMARWGGAILCSASAVVGACDHLDCHRGPFLVVAVGSNRGETCICTYSPGAAAWSEAMSAPPGTTRDFIDPLMRSALVGNALYFGLVQKDKSLRYDLESREMSWVRLPPTCHTVELRVLTTTEDGELGMVTAYGDKIYMWRRKAGGPPDDAGWRQDRVIELEGLLPMDVVLASPDVVGFAEGIGVIFVTANNALFTVDLKTNEAKKVCEGRGIRAVVPYMSFDTPVLGELVQMRDQVRVAQVHKKRKLLM